MERRVHVKQELKNDLNHIAYSVDHIAGNDLLEIGDMFNAGWRGSAADKFTGYFFSLQEQLEILGKKLKQAEKLC